MRSSPLSSASPQGLGTPPRPATTARSRRFSSATNKESEVANFDGVDELTIAVPRILSLDEEDGGLGTVVNATGKGFKNGTSLTVFVDKLSAVMWNTMDDSSNDMVPLTANMVTEYDVLMEDDKNRGNVAARTIPIDDDGDALYDDDGEALAPNRQAGPGRGHPL